MANEYTFPGREADTLMSSWIGGGVERETLGSGGGSGNQPRMIRRLRWWIGGLLFASTVINYIDRQTLSVLAPFLKSEYHWTNSDFALLIISFRVAYAVM